MEIIFNAMTFNDGRKIDNSIIEIYKQSIVSIYNSLDETLDLSLLNFIIVPENYKTELFEFQRKNNHMESLTENEFGCGLAQVVSSNADTGETVYNIIIDKNTIVSLYPNYTLQSIKEYLQDEDHYNEFLYTRQSEINVLCHELGHINDYGLSKNIVWINERKTENTVKSQYLTLAIQIWREYYACRTISFTFPYNIQNINDDIKMCFDTEKMLLEKRKKYNAKCIKLEDFLKEFFDYTKFILIKLSYMHGNLYCLENLREEAVMEINHSLEKSFAFTIWNDLGNTMNQLFEMFPNWESEYVFDQLILLLEKYHNQFDVFMIQKSEGIYYDIPVKL